MNSGPVRKLFFPVSLVLSGAMLFIAFIPVLGFSQNEPLLHIAGKFIAGKLCHTDPSKIPSVLGHNLFLCSRCSGIYAGAFLTGLLVLPAGYLTKFKLKNPLRIPLAMLLPMAADVLLYNSGIYSYNFTIAWFTGFLSGSGVILYIWNDFFQN